MAEAYDMQDADAVPSDWRQALYSQATQAIASLPEPSASVASHAVAATLGTPPDLFTLLTEMAALRQEVRLQRRELVKERQHNQAAYATLETGLKSLERHRQTVMDEARQQAAVQAIRPFLDIRDALARCQPGPLRTRRSLWQRLGSAMGLGCFPMATTQHDVVILLQQCDRALRQEGIEPLEVIGRPFDAEQMTAIAVEPNAALAPGCVLRQVVGGYGRHGALLRAAEVVVTTSA